MLKKDLKNMSFEDLVALQKAVNNTVIEKRNSDFGSLIKEIKKLEMQKKSLNTRIIKIEDAVKELFFENNFLKNIENCNYFISSEGFLHIYIIRENSEKSKSLDFDFESMQIVKNNGFSKEEIELIIEEINLLLNSEKKNEVSEKSKLDLIFEKPIEYQKEIFEALDNSENMSVQELDDIIDNYDLIDVDLQEFVNRYIDSLED